MTEIEPQTTSDETDRTPPPPYFDIRPWQSALAGLLARLEHHRAGMIGRRLAADAGLLLDRAEAMVVAVEDLARGTTFPAKLTPAVGEAVARAGMFVSAAQEVREELKQGLVRSVLTALSRAAVPSAAPAVRNCLESAGEALNGYFTLFTEKYPSSLAARGWVDAASGFVADYRQLVRDLPE
ncbi:MAG TPA: hypothetical protein VM533_20840 [Fimbriiglobus sp.]|jgi:hypothetical protein|nr:hypothetical protein [Fimbriiglobus sp.]